MSKRKKKGSRYYFTQDTEDAIVLYNKTNDSHKRNQIYIEHLKFPLEKLVENVFNTFKFEYFLDDPIDVQREVLSFILLNLHKYKGDRGRAFSYFSIVAKNYLILNNNKNYKVKKMYQDIEMSDEVFGIEDESENQRQEDYTQEFVNLMYDFWEKKITDIFEKDRDVQIAYSIIELFRYIDVIDTFNKKTIYLLIREMTGYTGQHITPVLNKMKPIQRRIYNDFLTTGTIRPERY
jgi:hypothetical protein